VTAGRLALSIAFWDYDRTLPLFDGRVPIEGCAPSFTLLRPEKAFAHASGPATFDVTELSLANHATALADRPTAYCAMPVFLSRAFRLGAIYIRADRGITAPRDLANKSVGLQEYGMTAAVVLRGILRDAYQLETRKVRWRVGGVDSTAPGRLADATLPDDIDVRAVAHGRTLDSMLVAGDIDALVSLRVPPSYAQRHPKVTRLFPDWRAAEESYFRTTGIFPIMHMVGIRRRLLLEHPWLAHSVFKGFAVARRIALDELAEGPTVALPWQNDELARTRALMGHDFWPYGVAANRRAIEALLRWLVEDGLPRSAPSVEDLFASALHNT
jgi:4,5-dihydroxyphthalate decarboxylase